MPGNTQLYQLCIKVFKELVSGKAKTIPPIPLDLAGSPEEVEFISSFNLFLDKYRDGMGFIAYISQGKLETDPPANNQVIAHFKQLHSGLRHLVWQTCRLVEGDLNQQVDFMGDFSTAFNTLIESLREKRDLEEQIRRSDQFHKTLLNTSPDGIAVLEADGVIQFVSENGFRMFGFDSERVISGTNFIDLIQAEQRELARTLINLTIQSIRGSAREFVVSRKNGENFWIEANMEALPGESQAGMIMVVYHEISLRKLLESQLQEYSQILELQARTDRMTGMLNHAEGIQTLEKEITLARITNLPLTVCYIDLDNLKHINDLYGHSEGDRMILDLSACIQKNIRKNDSVARMGGDEFLVVFPQANVSVAGSAISRINHCLQTLFESGSGKNPVSFSFGFAEYGPFESVTPEQLVNLADERMCSQKKEKKKPINAPEGGL